MEVSIKDGYKKAYVELLEIIKYFGKEYQEKIPKKLLEAFEENKDKNYKYSIDYSKKIEENKFLDETVALLAVIELEYLATQSEKELLIKSMKDNEIEYQKQLSEKYNGNNIFEKNKKEKRKNDSVNQDSIIEYKESR